MAPPVAFGTSPLPPKKGVSFNPVSYPANPRESFVDASSMNSTNPGSMTLRAKYAPTTVTTHAGRARILTSKASGSPAFSFLRGALVFFSVGDEVDEAGAVPLTKFLTYDW